MSRASSDEQLNFLLKCVKHSNNGKVDFTEVAKECGIVSKGAAAKRYERMMKANGIHPNGGPSEPPPPRATNPANAKPGIKGAATKKRKHEDPADNSNSIDEDDGFLKAKAEPEIKEEIIAPSGLDKYPTSLGSMGGDGAAASTLFDEFCPPEAFASHDIISNTFSNGLGDQYVNHAIGQASFEAREDRKEQESIIIAD